MPYPDRAPQPPVRKKQNFHCLFFYILSFRLPSADAGEALLLHYYPL
jgi:hypothetical protein